MASPEFEQPGGNAAWAAEVGVAADQGGPDLIGDDGFYAVAAGDTLSLLAQRFYGDLNLWQMIWDANYDQIGSTPDLIEIGWRLFIPPYDTQGGLAGGTIKGMDRARGSGAGFPDAAHPNGHIDPTYWEHIGTGYDHRLRGGRSASEGLRRAMAPDARLDCDTMMFAVLAYSVLETIGPYRFDLNFGAEGENNQDLVLGTEVDRSKLLDVISFPTPASVEDLQPGDAVYFKNDQRILAKHPGTFWRGENTIYRGDGLFSGFGLDDMTESELKEELARQFNIPPTPEEIADPEFDPALERATIQASDVPGIQLGTVMRLDGAAVDELK